MKAIAPRAIPSPTSWMRSEDVLIVARTRVTAALTVVMVSAAVLVKPIAERTIDSVRTVVSLAVRTRILVTLAMTESLEVSASAIVRTRLSGDRLTDSETVVMVSLTVRRKTFRAVTASDVDRVSETALNDESRREGASDPATASVAERPPAIVLTIESAGVVIVSPAVAE